jgi:ABC-2 type transport system ATP-binding protein
VRTRVHALITRPERRRADEGAAAAAPPDTQIAVSVRDLEVVRGGRRVLPGISLDVPAGQVTGLLGPSGCGKSTLMRSIVGVQKVAGGEVRVLGHPAGSPALRARVGYVTQAPSVYADLTVGENLVYFARIVRAPRERIDEVVAVVHLDREIDRPVGRLSDGQRARASLASALLGRPEVLVLDEPTVGLDPLLRRELWGSFRDLAASGVTIFVSSHVMDEAAHCDQLVLMRDGAVLAAEPPDDLRRRTGAEDLEGAFLALIEEEAA